jgi:hypothetical protein
MNKNTVDATDWVDQTKLASLTTPRPTVRFWSFSRFLPRAGHSGLKRNAFSNLGYTLQ